MDIAGLDSSDNSFLQLYQSPVQWSIVCRVYGFVIFA